MREADLAEVLQALAGRSLASELRQWVHGTRELPLRALLQAQGLQVHDDPAQPAQAWGLRVSEVGGNLIIKTVLRDSAAEIAGFAAGDEWLGLETSGAKGGAWRITRLDDVVLYAGAAKRATAIVARDQRLLRLPLQLPVAGTNWRISAQAEATALTQAWLRDRA